MMGWQRAEYLAFGRIDAEACPVEMRAFDGPGQLERFGAEGFGADQNDSAPRMTAVINAVIRITK